VATDIRQQSTPEGTIVEARLPHREASRYAALRTDLPPLDELDAGPIDRDDGPIDRDDGPRRAGEVG
jgi:hypothetical protein